MSPDGNPERQLPNDVPDVIDLIRTNYGRLTEAQRKVADFVLENPQEVSYLNSIQLSGRLRVGKATTVRFAQSLGFHGYGDFREALEERARGLFTAVDRLRLPRGRVDTIESVIGSVIDNDINNLELLRTDITPQLVEQVVRALVDARRVYVLGLRNSVSLAYFLWIGLKQLRSGVEFLSGGFDDWPELIHDAGPEDVLVAFSFRRYSRRTIQLVENADQLGVQIVAFSDRRNSPLALARSILVPCPYSGTSFFGSPTGAIGASSIILAAMAHGHHATSQQSLESIERVLKSGQVLVDPGPRRPGFD